MRQIAATMALLGLALTAAPGCIYIDEDGHHDGDDRVGSARLSETHDRDVHRLRVRGTMRLAIRLGGPEGQHRIDRPEGDDVLDKDYDGDELELDGEGWNLDAGPRVDIELHRLDSLEIEDTVRVKLYDASGALDVELEDTGLLTINSGTLQRLRARIDDASRLEASDIQIEEATIEASDAASAELCTRALTQTTDDASSVSLRCRSDDE